MQIKTPKPGFSSSSSRPERLGDYEVLAELVHDSFGLLAAARSVSGQGGYDVVDVVTLRSIQPSAAIDAWLVEDICQAAWGVKGQILLHVLPVTDVIVADGRVGVVTDYSEGEFLRSLLRLSGTRRIPFPVGVAIRIALDVLSGLQSLQDAVAKKPELTKLVTGGLTADRVLVGVAGESELAEVVLSGRVAVKPVLALDDDALGYRAPEHYQPDTEPDVRADLFVVGTLLWEMLANKALFVTADLKGQAAKGFDSPTVQNVIKGPIEKLNVPSVPPALAAVVEKALQRDPSARFQNPKQFKEAIESAAKASIGSHADVARFVEQVAGQILASRKAIIHRALRLSDPGIAPGAPAGGVKVVSAAEADKPETPKPGAAKAARPGLGSSQRKATIIGMPAISAAALAPPPPAEKGAGREAEAPRNLEISEPSLEALAWGDEPRTEPDSSDIGPIEVREVSYPSNEPPTSPQEKKVIIEDKAKVDDKPKGDQKSKEEAKTKPEVRKFDLKGKFGAKAKADEKPKVDDKAKAADKPKADDKAKPDLFKREVKVVEKKETPAPAAEEKVREGESPEDARNSIELNLVEDTGGPPPPPPVIKVPSPSTPPTDAVDAWNAPGAGEGEKRAKDKTEAEPEAAKAKAEPEPAAEDEAVAPAPQAEPAAKAAPIEAEDISDELEVQPRRRQSKVVAFAIIGVVTLLLIVAAVVAAVGKSKKPDTAALPTTSPSATVTASATASATAEPTATASATAAPTASAAPSATAEAPPATAEPVAAVPTKPPPAKEAKAAPTATAAPAKTAVAGKKPGGTSKPPGKGFKPKGI
ncbi:MAG: hypothetical protein HY898_19650 [Deltaproteobacteria bacterium]|nr:hypothetical protein [Deltaproteobacteria bacterium]